jgi:hypothetical protein
MVQIGQAPAGFEHQLCHARHLVEIDLVDGVCWLVVIHVSSVKVEDHDRRPPNDEPGAVLALSVELEIIQFGHEMACAR